jgi:hypothetical protein
VEGTRKPKGAPFKPAFGLSGDFDFAYGTEDASSAEEDMKKTEVGKLDVIVILSEARA